MPQTILIVEDEFLIALDLQLRLEAHGWEVIGPAASVQQALELLDDETPTLALLDVHLGTELITPVAKYLREHDVPFAVASAYERPERIAGAVLAGVPNAGKPTSEQRLLSALRELTNA